MNIDDVPLDKLLPFLKRLSPSNDPEVIELRKAFQSVAMAVHREVRLRRADAEKRAARIMGEYFPSGQNRPEDGPRIRDALIRIGLRLRLSVADPVIAEFIEFAKRADDLRYLMALGDVVKSEGGYFPSRTRIMLLTEWCRCPPLLQLGPDEAKSPKRRDAIGGREQEGRTIPLGLRHFTMKALTEYIAIHFNARSALEIDQFNDNHFESLKKDVQRLGLKSASKKRIRRVTWIRGRIALIPLS